MVGRDVFVLVAAGDRALKRRDLIQIYWVKKGWNSCNGHLIGTPKKRH